MLMLAETMPIDIEILDASDNTLHVVPAELHHLDGEAAVLTVSPDKAKRLHWGTRLRFEIGDNPTIYEITGAVVACEAQSDSDTVEILVRLWGCRIVSQMRSTPRRRSQFDVAFRPIDSPTRETGHCLDIGGGGMRLQIPMMEPLPEHLTLQFCLPSAPAEPLELQGRIIRAVPCERGAAQWEVALCFERLTVDQGMAIARFLSE